jgi:hypothetical protein
MTGTSVPSQFSYRKRLGRGALIPQNVYGDLSELHMNQSIKQIAALTNCASKDVHIRL